MVEFEIGWRLFAVLIVALIILTGAVKGSDGD